MNSLRFLQVVFLITIIKYGQSLPKASVRRPLDLSSIVLLKCDLKSDNMTDFFIDLALNETTCPVKACNSSITDVVNAAELHKFNSSFLANSSKSLNVSGVTLYNAIMHCNMTVNSALHYLNVFETTFAQIYDNFVRLIEKPGAVIPNVLKIVNVSANNFLSELSFGTDATRLQVLSTGNYTMNNIVLVLKNTSLTVTDLISCLPLNKIAKNINKVNSTKISNFVDSLNITSKDIKNFFSALNVSSSNFTNYTAFAKMQNDLDKYLNQDGALGVFTSKSLVVTSSRAVMIQKSNLDFVMNYTTFYLVSPNTTTKYKVENVSLDSGKYVDEVALINTHTPILGVPSKIGLIYNATKIFNCTYVTKLPNETLVMENFTSAVVYQANFTATKSSKTIYSLGSPIYCQNRMYGFAIKNRTDTIDFTKFKTYNITVHPIRPIDTTEEKNSGTLMYYSCTTLLFAMVVHYFQ